MDIEVHDVKYKEEVYKLKPIDLKNNALRFSFIDNPDFPVSIRDGDRVTVFLASGEVAFTKAVTRVGGFSLLDIL
ncbi:MULTISPECIES: hypothetical protein [Providencia]|uniref:Uncharacterized protein n=1 Tax=Providencia rettgeri TaxID=587 RepID=A0AB35L9M9_PRORE|nr:MULTISPECIES: hypothetical protein [Providencia]MDH2305034.1 hypothetical protein [Providencia rettgeri]